MTEQETLNTDLKFLKGGGEMGAMILAHDWSKTPLGAPGNWPPSLRTAVAIMLDNPFAMYIAWGKEYIQLYNDGYRPILGATKHPQALGISTRETFAEIWHIIGSMFDGVMEGKAVGFPDFMLPLNRNGYIENCYFDFSYSPIRKENGEVGGVLVTVIETTNKKIAENLMRESEERFRIMAEGSDMLISVVNKDLETTYYNKAWLDFTGRSMENLLNYGWEDIVHPDDRQEFLKQYKVALENKKSIATEFRIKNKDGKYRWLLSKIPARHQEDGGHPGFVSTCVDITDDVEARTALEETEQNLRNTILQAPVAMCIFRGPEYIVELANDRMYEFWGKKKEEVFNKPIFEGLPEAKDQGFEDLLNGVYTTGKTFVAEDVPITLPRSGKLEQVYINFVYEAYREADKTISGILAVAVDVTPQMLARQKIEEVVSMRTRELADANDSLKKSNAELAQFAYIASHDLQEPLRKISTFSQMLENQIADSLDEQSKRYLDKINSSALRMMNLIKDVLNFSELVVERDRFQLTDLEKIIQNIQSDFELLLEQKEALLQCEALPLIEAIPLQMSQLFSNLISNSLKFTRPGVPPVIRITAKIVAAEEITEEHLDVPGPYVHIRLTDNGIGFKPEFRMQIFNIFQRLHGKASFAGTGIGLAMCKKIALNHMGAIDAEGSSEKGAVFNIFLPVKQLEKKSRVQ